MCSKKKYAETDAENIANLINYHAPEFNDDDDEFLDDTTAKLSYDDQDHGAVEDGPQRSKFRAQNVDLLEAVDVKYSGKVASRKSLKNSDDEIEETFDEDDPSERDKETEDYHGSNDEEEYVSDEEDSASNEEDIASSEGDIASGEEDIASGEEDANLSESDATKFQHFKSSKSSDFSKGNCVRNQLNIWENLLEMRIQLQKSLSASNKLPIGDNFKELSKTADESYSKKLVETKKSVTNALDKMLLLQNLLVKNYPATKRTFHNKKQKPDKSDDEITSEEDSPNESSDDDEEDATPKKKMKLQDYEGTISKRHDLYTDFRNKTIQIWNERSRIGTLTKNNAQSNSLLKDIELILSNKQKLIKKTQQKKSNYTILGEEETEEFHNENIYDDSDFYHQLLKELIEFKSSDVTDPIQLGKQWVQLQNMRSKMKRKVDTRATKGRKLRFTVHTKLVNFMAPMDNGLWTDEAKTELFNSLFGKKQLRN